MNLLKGKCFGTVQVGRSVWFKTPVRLGDKTNHLKINHIGEVHHLFWDRRSINKNKKDQIWVASETLIWQRVHSFCFMRTSQTLTLGARWLRTTGRPKLRSSYFSSDPKLKMGKIIFVLKSTRRGWFWMVRVFKAFPWTPRRGWFWLVKSFLGSF